ncbi:KamA family radical SAM protein [Desulfoluna spongiiphila]|uniref:L-lysine 2,3-aminomutase n=1 Tax=Desulfoluna spongiiphila TaxID=419481 RepID=A0A1G5I3T7_9BACT|nr:KamA family radical SAM protein [Desulfoluna spongiiphila]SCY70726.1 L-lysine 2,3-aminomutase [Desulfoluna spongiiphila]
MNWKEILDKSVVSAEGLTGIPGAEVEEISRVAGVYPMRINPYWLKLMKKAGAPLWRQAVPCADELTDSPLLEDPLCEEKDSPVFGLTHRYPDRVIFLVSNRCALYCRHCMRKRKVGKHAGAVTDATIEAGLAYIEQTPAVRDVIVTGGDPLLVDDDKIEFILKRLSAIPHVEMIRIHTRVPATLPMRITAELCAVLSRCEKLWLNTHFNHPAEFTPEAEKALRLLNRTGAPLGCQTVLLKGVNDSPAVMAELMRKLTKNRVRPYYIHHGDAVKGTGHFRTSIETGLAVVNGLRGHLSGLCVPAYVIDLPGGGGKVPLLPESILDQDAKSLTVKGYDGKTYTYPL